MVDLAAQEGREDALLATGLGICKGDGHQVFPGSWLLVTAIQRLGPSSRCHDHPNKEEAAKGILEAPSTIFTAAFPRATG